MIILSNCHALPRCIPCFDEEQVCCTPSTHEHNPWVRTMKQRGVCCLQTLLPADPVLFVRSDSNAMGTAPPTSHDKTAHNLSGGAGDQQGEEGPRKQSPKTPPRQTQSPSENPNHTSQTTMTTHSAKASWNKWNGRAMTQRSKRTRHGKSVGPSIA